MLFFCLLAVSLTQFLTYGYAYTTFPLLMPDVQPTAKDTYLCTAFRMPTQDSEYIVGFEPNATMDTVHHILLYGCTVPGYQERDSPRIAWNCGGMGGQSLNNYNQAPVCLAGSKIIYAWAKNAPPLSLPDGVGFKVGAGSEISFLVLQIHYANVDRFTAGEVDSSGIILRLLPSSTDRIDKRAGVYILGTGGSYPPMSITHAETACKITEKATFYPFAFRTHTHKLGKVVAGYVVKPDGSWNMIGKHDPQQPQMFYPSEKGIEVYPGDVLAARCTMDNFLNHTISTGATADDEMCNFYIMYYVNGDKLLEEGACFTYGPPFYSWESDDTLDGVPDWVDKDASSLEPSPPGDPRPR